MRSGYSTLLAAALVLGAASRCASASTITFQFDATLQTGALAGTSFTGTGTYDSSAFTGVGEEYASLTSVNFILGVPFTISDLDQGGQVILENGALSYFTAAFFTPPPDGAPVTDIAFGFGGPGIIGYLTSDSPGGGSGVYQVSSLAAPEPAALVLTGLGIVAIAVAKRRIT